MTLKSTGLLFIETGTRLPFALGSSAMTKSEVACKYCQIASLMHLAKAIKFRNEKHVIGAIYF